jgi:16S rRNA G527 N7-methylase RsmG
MNTNNKNLDHYDCPDLITRIKTDLLKVGKSSNNLTIDDLATVDEFHLRGSMATNKVIELLQAKADSHLIDLGSGLGGPAR